jgi:hypothetical protein
MFTRTSFSVALFAAAFALRASTASAQTTPPAPAVSPAWKKSLYSLPWVMRPAIAPNLIRLDTVYANYAAPSGNGGGTVVSMLTAGYRPIPSAQTLGFYFRMAFNVNMPGTGSGAVGLSNPMLMTLWTPEVAPNVRLSVFGAVAIPVGMGGGDTPDMDTRNAVRAGIQARLAMDNALFAQNYLTPIVGLGAAWTYRGLTVQAEATVLQLIRVRGEAKDPDEARTNFTVGAHVGYRIIPQLTASAEVHYQHWLWTPSALAENLRGQFTATLGLRANLPVTHAGILRPGVAFSLPIGGAMETNNYWEVQLDIPFAF